MSLLDFLRPQQAQAPGAMQQPRQSGLSQMMQPEVMAAMAGQLLGNEGNMNNFGNAFRAVGPVMAQTRQKNQTVELLKKEAPDIAQAIESGAMTPSDGYKAYFDRKKGAGADAYKVVGDQIFNTADQSWMKPPSASGGEFRFGGNAVEAQALNGLIDSGQLTPEQAQQLAAGKTITNPADGSMVFMTPQGVFGQPAQGGNPQPISSQQPGTAEQGGAAQLGPGLIPLTPGKPGKLATEGERRNRSLYSVVEPELKIVEKNFSALSSLGNQAAAAVPFSEYLTTPEYQQAANSLQTIVASYLYSVSGATATPEEVRKQTSILTPRPGEDQASIDSKLRRVRTMVEAIKLSGGEPNQGGTTPAPGVDYKTKYGLD
jgi:hypothetical protein